MAHEALQGLGEFLGTNKAATPPVPPAPPEGVQNPVEWQNSPIPIPATPPPPAPAAKPSSGISVPPELLGKTGLPPVTTPDPRPAPVPDEAAIAKLPQSQQNVVRQMRDHIKTLENKLTEAEKRTATPANEDAIKSLKQQLEETQAELDRVALERSPRFSLKYEQPKQALLGQIKDYLVDLGVAEDEAKKIAADASRMTIKDRIAALTAASPDAGPALIPLFAQIDAIEKQRVAELNQAKQARERDEQEHVTRTQQVREQHLSKSIKTAMESGHFLLTEVQGNDSWNQQVNGVRSMIKEVFESDDPEVQSTAMTLGVLAPVYLNLFKQASAQIDQLQAELAKYGRAFPGMRGAPSVPASSEPQGAMTPEQAAAKLAARLPAGA